MLINNVPLEEFGAKLKMNYEIGGCELDVSVFHGRNRSFFNLLNTNVGLKELKLPIVFHGKDEADTARKKSLFEMELLGKSELTLDDGFSYSIAVQSIGKETHQSAEMIEAEYVCAGVRHGDFIKKNGNTVYCDSTLPYTDCILTATVSADGINYKVGSVTFPEVAAGEVLTVDGINGRILIDGIPAAERADWLEFPKLKPGKNEIQCPDELTVGYYPVYF